MHKRLTRCVLASAAANESAKIRLVKYPINSRHLTPHYRDKQLNVSGPKQRLFNQILLATVTANNLKTHKSAKSTQFNRNNGTISIQKV